MEISRNVSLPTIKNNYLQIMGRPPRAKKPDETYNAYKNLLVNAMLKRPNVTLKYGERISKNKPSDKAEQGQVGRPRTLASGRKRVCEIVAKGKNKNKVAEQNYECKSEVMGVEVKEEKEFKEEEKFIGINELENKGFDILRRIVTALVPKPQRTKTILQERYGARRGVLNDLSVANMIDLLRQSGVERISSEDAFKILLK